MKKTNNELLVEIHDALLSSKATLECIRNNTRTIRQDISGIREGRTGADAKQRQDPLSPADRAQVDEVKRRYKMNRKQNPNYSMLSISKAVRRERIEAGYTDVYESDLALNHRAYVEICREDRGLPPF